MKTNAIAAEAQLTMTEKVDIGIAESDLGDVCALLTVILSDTMTLLVKTKNFHWNVTGPHFNELHSFFQSQYTTLESASDAIAERIRTLGYPTIGAMTAFLNFTSLKENVQLKESAGDMLSELLSDHEAVIKKLRIAVNDTANEHNDAGTSDFLTGLLQQHEKMAWMTRSYLAD